MIKCKPVIYILVAISYLLTCRPVLAYIHTEGPTEKFSPEIMSDSGNSTNKVNIALSIGFYELSALRIGYQISDQWGIALKGNFISPGFFEASNGHGYGGGLGIKISRTFEKWLIFNNVSFEPTYIIRAYIDGPSKEVGGAMIEINTGHEIIDRQGLHFFWSIGYSWRFVIREDPWNRFSFKLGLNYQL